MILYAAVLYILPVSCIFKELFGFKCPGCGMTRALVRALQLDFVGAFAFHGMFWSVPVLYMCFLLDGKLFKNKYVNMFLYIIIAVGFILNWLLNTNI